MNASDVIRQLPQARLFCIERGKHTFSLRSASLIGLFVQLGGVTGDLEEVESAMVMPPAVVLYPRQPVKMRRWVEVGRYVFNGSCVP